MTIRAANAAGAKDLLDSGAGWVLIDVRTVQEFEQGRPAGAVNVPLTIAGPAGMAYNPGFVDSVKGLAEPATGIIFTCATGNRSMQACQIMAEEGYADLVNLRGGFFGARDMFGRVAEPGWQASGQPVEYGAGT